MRLNVKILICNIVLSLGILLAGSIGLYYLISYSVYDELDNHLLQHKIDIVEQVQSNPESLEQIQNLGGLGSYEWVDITVQGDRDQTIPNQFATVDTVRSASDTIAETYRRLTTSISVENQHYTVKIYEEVTGWQNISQTILVSVLAGLVVWVILLYFVNQIVFKRLLTPFYNTVNTLETISQPTDFDKQFPQSTTYEVDVLNRALNTMMNQIRESFEDQKKFIQNVSHELLTPLAIIRQKTEKMLSQSSELDRQLVETASDIHETTVRLSRLSNALLLISRVENKQYERNEEVDIRQVTETVLGELEDFITLKNIVVEKNFKTDIAVLGNQELIESALYNVIQNAVKFSPENSRLTIKSSRAPTGHKELQIIDSGPGISLEIKDSLFDRFQSVNNSSTKNDNYRGSGLGLSLVKSICDLHGFECVAENRPNSSGAIFTIVF